MLVIKRKIILLKLQGSFWRHVKMLTVLLKGP